jgi:hypothetical protein
LQFFGANFLEFFSSFSLLFANRFIFPPFVSHLPTARKKASPQGGGQKEASKKIAVRAGAGKI